MSFDPNSTSDRADAADWLDTGCPYCRGRGWVQFDRDNPYACEPCGCDEIEEEDE